jgi:hypothetical protein
MPNWCNNTVEISHKDKNKMEALVAAINEGKFCDHVIPVPEDLHIVAGRVGDDNDPKQIELEAQEKANLEKHGYDTWYDFCVSKWGTKWDVDAYNPVEFDDQWDKNNKITFGFDSAWSPPLGVYEALIEQGYAVRAYYYESGMGFCGMFDEDGDDYYEIGGMSSTEVADTIPSELDEMFGISECIAEYEAEEEDEVQEWYEDGVEKLGLEPHKVGNENQ